MVFVPAGEFTMGSQVLEAEKPIHTVYLDAFWIDTYEVTNALYKQCVDAGVCEPHQGAISTGSDYNDPTHSNFPVTQVTWADGERYCEWAGKRLPTEAEWEKAARGTDARVYPCGKTFDPALLNSAFNNNLHTTAVGSFPGGASPYGAMDMAGNVWEWVADWYDDHYYAQSPRDNPKSPEEGTQKIARGGGYGGTDAVMRTSQRRVLYPDDYGGWLGFRCAR
jgi:formylglycine-generating enzyme required for sulfatase activity